MNRADPGRSGQLRVGFRRLCSRLWRLSHRCIGYGIVDVRTIAGDSFGPESPGLGVENQGVRGETVGWLDPDPGWTLADRPRYLGELLHQALQCLTKAGAHWFGCAYHFQ